MVTDIVFSSEEINLNVDDTETIVAEVLPEDADNKTLEWSSDSPSIVSVTVDEDTHSAVVKGVSEGEAIITAAATDGSGVSAMCNVVVNTPGPKLVTDITLEPEELTLNEMETGTVTANILPINADNKVLSWNVDMPEIILSVSEDTHSATVQGEIVGIDGIITVSATDGSGVSAMCNVSFLPAPPPTADYYIKSAQYYTIEYDTNLGRTIVFKNADDTENLTLDVVDENTINIGKYKGIRSVVNTYATMDFTQKSEYIISGIEDGDAHIKLVKKGNDYPEIWIYRDNNVFEKITYKAKTGHYPITVNYRYTYIGDIDNPYKHIRYDFSNQYYYVNYGSQIDSSTASYTAKIVTSSSSGANVVTLYDPDGTVFIKKADISGKSFELTSVKDDITTQDLYASISSQVYCEIEIPNTEYGHILYGINGSSRDPITYPFPYKDTIDKTHTWSPT